MPRIVPALLTLLLVLAVPASAHAARGMEFALWDDNVFLDQEWMDRETALDHAVELRAKRIRVNLLWSRLLVSGAEDRREPEGGPVYDFSRVDALLDAAATRRIKLQLTITGPAPAWATANRKVGNHRPDVAKFRAFARTVAEHFEGRVDRYSIWNEPNWHTWLYPAKSAARIYRQLYRAGYAAVKDVDPRAQVLFGELAPSGGSRATAPLRFLRDVTCTNESYRRARPCKPLKADGVALHPYQFLHAPQIAAGRPDDVPIGALSRLTRALDLLTARRILTSPRKRKRKLDLYLTEFGYLTVGSRAQKPRVRAKWLHDAFGIARRHPRVRQLLQYQLVDPPEDRLWHTAILHRDGSPQATYAGLAKASAANR